MDKVIAILKQKKELVVAVLLAFFLASTLLLMNSLAQISQDLRVSSGLLFSVMVLLNSAAILFTGWLLIRRKAERFMYTTTLAALIAYIFLYYIRLSSSNLALGSLFFFNTRFLATVGIVALFGGTVYFLLRHEVLPFFLRAGLAFLVLLSTFSFFNFVAENARVGTEFTQDLLNLFIGDFAVVPWLLFSAVALACITRADLNFRLLKQELPTLLSLTVLFLIALLSIYWVTISSYGIVNIFYWQSAFMGFIIWDMSYKLTGKWLDIEGKQLGFVAQWKDVMYYTFLLLLVIISPILFSYLPR